MPTELIKDFIGKECSITLFGDALNVKGKIISIENNWIKVEGKTILDNKKAKNSIKLLNIDMIIDITILPEDKQK